MARFRNLKTGVVVSVDDSKSDRFARGFEPADEPAKKTTARKSTASSSKND